VQISDLHFSPFVSDRFLERISRRIQKLAPDIIVFTGDLITHATLSHEERLYAFLSSLSCPLGTFAIFGNHDYSEYVSLAKDGNFRRIKSDLPMIMRGFARLFSVKESDNVGAIVRSPIPEHEPLKALMQKAGIRLLHNETVQVGKKNGWINITGLGDLMTNQCQPMTAFSHYDNRTAGIVLSHNPDSYEQISHYPGDLFLFGHTHGGQINLPYIWKRVTPIKNRAFKSGLFHIDEHFLYVSRGLGASFPFRWFSPPEIALFTLVRQGPIKIPLWQRLFPQETTQEAVCGTS
jgi:predicted MPP superfamily phosphohydrolase